MASDMATSSYTYTDLPTDRFHIRLLQIKNATPADKNKGDWTVPITCNLTTFHFASAPPYRCLSYVWGAPNPEAQAIIINDRTLRIQKNLLGFLRRLRAGSSDPDGYLWIDAICINQANLTERADQVGRMGYIYSRAAAVIAWLGYEYDRVGDASDNGEDPRDSTLEDGADDAVAFLKELAKRFRAWVEAGGQPWTTTQLSQHAFDAKEVYDMLELKPVPMRTWRALAVLLDRAYFQRAWIVQEAALAKQMVFVLGFEVISWDDLIQVSIFLQASGWHLMLLYFMKPTGLSLPFGYLPLLFASLRSCCKLESVPTSLGGVVKLPTETMGYLPPAGLTKAQTYDFLARLIILSRSFGAGDPRDKVFAPLALTSLALARFNPDLPQPYYTTTAQKVYVDITISILEHSSDLYILSQLEDASARHLPDLPSWCPDYSQVRHGPFTDVPNLIYDCLKGRTKFCTVDREDRRVTLEGCFFDALERLPEHNLDVMFRARDFRPLMRFCVQHMPSKQGQQDRTEVLWRTLIGDCDGSSCPASSETAGCFKRNIQLVEAINRYGDRQRAEIPAIDDWSDCALFDELQASSPAAQAAIPSARELQDFAEEWRLIMAGSPSELPKAKTVASPSDIFALASGRVYGRRRLFLSSKGVLGLAPASARKDDQVWFLSGGKVPFILRPELDRSGRRTFSLIGEAYVHGYMFGQVLKEDPIFQEVDLM